MANLYAKDFDIKYRPQIESGEYKVYCKKGNKPVRIICWDSKYQKWPIIGLMPSSIIVDDGQETFIYCDLSGTSSFGEEYNLFIITPEEELTEWEKAISRALTDAQLIPRDKDGIANIHDINEFVKKKSAELLDLARVALVDEQTKREDLSFSRGLRQGREEAKKSPWIPASNPPDHDMTILLCNNIGGTSTCVGAGHYLLNGMWVDSDDKLTYPDYWMEIPELPKED